MNVFLIDCIRDAQIGVKEKVPLLEQVTLVALGALTRFDRILGAYGFFLYAGIELAKKHPTLKRLAPFLLVPLFIAGALRGICGIILYISLYNLLTPPREKVTIELKTKRDAPLTPIARSTELPTEVTSLTSLSVQKPLREQISLDGQSPLEPKNELQFTDLPEGTNWKMATDKEIWPLGLPNKNGSDCFISALSSSFLGDKKKLLEVVREAKENAWKQVPRRQENKDLPKENLTPQEEKKLYQAQALALIEDYLEKYRARDVVPEATKMRTALRYLSYAGLGDDVTQIRSAQARIFRAMQGQQDASEMLDKILDGIQDNLPPKEISPFTSTFQVLKAYGPPEDLAENDIPKAAQFLDEKSDQNLYNAENRVLMNCESFNNIPLAFDEEIDEQTASSTNNSSQRWYNFLSTETKKGLQTASFSKMLKEFFYKKDSGSEPLKRQNGESVEKEFPILCERKRFIKAPIFLTISCKRSIFEQEAAGTFVPKKIDRDLKDVKEILDLPGDYFVDGSGARYRLDGATIHTGVPKAGHYTSLRRMINTNGSHSYFSQDNDLVRSISQEAFLYGMEKATTLFFTKI